ncbi:MAG TPA: hypothetical protein PKL84_10635, partial [Candidatus Hydrogenedentes bacterium]|nr:hypothetical protein [Candidatus Hydrogenedentota bacterium]
MRFAKRNRGWLTGRRLFGDGHDVDAGGVASEERNALLENDDEFFDGVLGDPRPASGGDPTHRLLTALGRFQRQVARAESGAAQEQWCDECMNQLITGIELSMEQNWSNVAQALTDTARVLHSYERLERARECVAFLQDSYEILCLMVGDLIVDNVRSGVTKKWRDRFQRAVEEMRDLGIPLVEDEEEEEPETQPRPAPVAQEPPPVAPVEQASLFELVESAAPVEETVGRDDVTPIEEVAESVVFAEPEPAALEPEEGGNLPALGELIEEEEAEAEAAPDQEVFIEETETVAPTDEEELEEEAPFDAVEELSADEALGAPKFEELPEETTPFEEPATDLVETEAAAEEAPAPLEPEAPPQPEPEPPQAAA